MLHFVAHDLVVSCTFWDAAHTAGTVRPKLLAVLKPGLFSNHDIPLKLAAGPWLLLISSSKCYIMEKFWSTHQCLTQAPKLAFFSSYNRLIHVTIWWFFFSLMIDNRTKVVTMASFLLFLLIGQVYQQYQAPGGYPPQQPGAPQQQQQYGMQYPGKNRTVQVK